MCDIVQINVPRYDLYGEISVANGIEEHIVTLNEPDYIQLNDWIYDEGVKAELFCRHDPNDPWHKMELPEKGMSLDCPAGTELKLVTPEGAS